MPPLKMAAATAAEKEYKSSENFKWGKWSTVHNDHREQSKLEENHLPCVSVHLNEHSGDDEKN